MKEFGPAIRGAEGRVIFQHKKELVNVLSRQYAIPDSFFDVHHSAKREQDKQGIQDPKVWVDALQIKHDAQTLAANLDFDQGRNTINFKTKGEFPEGIDPKSKAAVLVSLIIGEAKLMAVQAEMPETYATGIGVTQRAIEGIQKRQDKILRNWKTHSIKSIEELDNIVEPGFSLNKKLALVTSPVILSLIGSACAPISVVGPVIVGPSSTSTAEVATPTEIAKNYTGTLNKASQATIDNYWKIASESGKINDQIAKGLAKKDIVGFTTKLTSGSTVKDVNFTYFIDPVTGDERLITQTAPNGWTELQKVAGGPKNVVMWAAGTEVVFEYQYSKADDPSSTGFVVRFHEASIYGGDLLPGHAANLAVKIDVAKTSAGGHLLRPSVERNVKLFSFTENPDITKYKEEVISCDDLLNGKYKAWLESLEPTHFDPNKVKEVELIHWDNGKVSYRSTNAPHWEGANAGKEPFNRNRTFAYCTYQGNEYIVTPVEYRDVNHPDKNQWVQMVINITGLTEAQIQETISIWKNDMNINLWYDSNVTMYTSAPDPLIQAVKDKYPNLPDKVDKFADTGANHVGNGDRTALDLPGIVFLSVVGTNSGHWYE